jgi:hypothetical protein
LTTFDGKAFFFFIQRSVELRVILSGVGKKPLLGHDAPERRLSQNLGQYFLHRAIEDCGPAAAFYQHLIRSPLAQHFFG